MSRPLGQVVVDERNSCEADRFVQSASRCVTGVATSSNVDEAKALVAKSLDGEHHQGSSMTATLVIRVHGNHLDNAERFVVVLL